MQGNNLVANNIVASSKLRRQLNRSLEAVFDEVVSDPDVGADDSLLGELGPAEVAGGHA